jgi:hypothetical protein
MSSFVWLNLLKMFYLFCFGFSLNLEDYKNARLNIGSVLEVSSKITLSGMNSRLRGSVVREDKPLSQTSGNILKYNNLNFRFGFFKCNFNYSFI